MNKKQFTEEIIRRQNERALKKLAQAVTTAENEGKEFEISKKYKLIFQHT